MSPSFCKECLRKYTPSPRKRGEGSRVPSPACGRGWRVAPGEGRFALRNVAIGPDDEAGRLLHPVAFPGDSRRIDGFDVVDAHGVAAKNHNVLPQLACQLEERRLLSVDDKRRVGCTPSRSFADDGTLVVADRQL